MTKRIRYSSLNSAQMRPLAYAARTFYKMRWSTSRYPQTGHLSTRQENVHPCRSPKAWKYKTQRFHPSVSTQISFLKFPPITIVEFSKRYLCRDQWVSPLAVVFRFRLDLCQGSLS